MKTQILIGVVLIGVTALYGQNKVEYGGAAFQFAGVAGAEGRVFGVEGFSSQMVADRPFSATEGRHSLQVLGDGTRIENTETNRLYRDDQGRTRVERAGGTITIFDPIVGFTAELHPETRMAIRSNIPSAEARAANGLLSALRTKVESDLRQSQEAPATAEKLKAEVASYKKEIVELEQQRLSTTEGQHLSAGSSAQFFPERTVTVSIANGLVVSRVGGGPGDNASVENLPAQMINGALAEGTRTTQTIPAGKIGNDRPISILNERWFSHDLQLLIKSTSSDPRFGDTTYQLTNIVQSAPDPSLFQIPADYTIRK